MASALLFARDEVDEIGDWTAAIRRLGRSSILWIDLEGPDVAELRQLGERLELSQETSRALEDRKGGPSLKDHDTYLHVSVYVVRNDHDRELEQVEFLISKRWLVTVHESQLESLERFRERASGSGDVGNLGAGVFLADVLEWVLADYLDAFEKIEEDLDDVDARSMQGKVETTESVLADLVDVRREIGRVRRALSSHREILLALTRPEIAAVVDSEAAERFSSLLVRFEEAMAAARDSRESVVGSFDVLIASMGQRTNEVVKVLTLLSMLFLPGALIAGILGMNFKIGAFEQAAFFWVTVAVIVGILVATLGIARAKRWI